METDKLRSIITRKNERLEDDALRTAEQIIEAIVREQQALIAGNERIALLRKELADLQVETVDVKAVLGEA